MSFLSNMIQSAVDAGTAVGEKIVLPQGDSIVAADGTKGYQTTEPTWGMLDPSTNQPIYRALDTPANLPPAVVAGGGVGGIGPTLSDLWNKVELAITPESEGERLVNEIYGRDENGVPITPPTSAIPPYDPQELTVPAVVVSAKKTITAAGNAIQDNLIKYGFIFFGALVALVVVYAFAGSYGRKLAS